MTLAADLALLTIDPATGRSMLGSSETDPVLGGAALVDLVNAERCDVEGPPKKARVCVLDARPLGDPALDRALARIKPGRKVKASTLVPRLGKGTRRLLLDQLVREEAIVPVRAKILGVIPLTRHEIVDVPRRDALLASVTAVLIGDVEPDETTGPLIGLLSAGNLVKRLVPKPARSAAVRRGRDIAKGEWAGAASRAAIAAASAAVAVAASSDSGGGDGGGS